MTSVGTAELKAHLGKYLNMVKRGESVEVTSHHHPIAELRPSCVGTDMLITPPTRPVSDIKKLKAVRLSGVVDGVDIFITDRVRR